MRNTILVAGATGNLGYRICMALINKGANVKALLREDSDPDKSEKITAAGITVVRVDYNDIAQIAAACIDVDCVVSALAGLSDVIVDIQKLLLDAALEAGVSRFIPSDFCTDYNLLVPGENRNFDLRREFTAYVDSTPIKVSSVFNGAFADILKYNTPILDLKNRTIAYWGKKADWKLDFTTMDNTAAFTAEVAMDKDAPRDLHIASFQISPKMLSSEIKSTTGQVFETHEISSMEEFAKVIQKQRSENPAGEHELYAKWQQAQYLYSMYAAQRPNLDNSRYPDLKWTTASSYLETFIR